ncbi:hypothetical protein CUREO_0237 [Campylobacter ureolyticus RIGS 9880]|uniref:Uncharacterized protein n=2 Tax=Campylobacter ureolyticus TaxID=827 RepID=A0A6N2T884_9BACT|nr:hypothetical protein [Campylobacter ureolyticus]AKT90119.1 hypothetical protein CUREO_0237 [Campylobacter ureolyticus RIGS 9880]MCR8699783.1 hypothetical protein [Campylobacter ureolyticus]MCZ6155233.1 hypothetical protein [Campylobacter ureolyticus]MDK8322459.1 hypothetical protein [Campylobacter ureolyticus]MDU7070624.1 hypothetical protein [Campylobacter ureolyticus]
MKKIILFSLFFSFIFATSDLNVSNTNKNESNKTNFSEFLKDQNSTQAVKIPTH